MFSKKLFFTLSVFLVLMITTPIVKNKTRNLEKDIRTISREISILEKNIDDAKIDFIYLSNPQKIKKGLSVFSEENHIVYNYSKIFYSIEHFIHANSKKTKLQKKIKNE